MNERGLQIFRRSTNGIIKANIFSRFVVPIQSIFNSQTTNKISTRINPNSSRSPPKRWKSTTISQDEILLNNPATHQTKTFSDPLACREIHENQTQIRRASTEKKARKIAPFAEEQSDRCSGNPMAGSGSNSQQMDPKIKLRISRGGRGRGIGKLRREEGMRGGLGRTRRRRVGRLVPTGDE